MDELFRIKAALSGAVVEVLLQDIRAHHIFRDRIHETKELSRTTRMDFEPFIGCLISTS